MTVAFKTLLSLVNSIDALVKSTLNKEEIKVEGWIEPHKEAKTTDQTGVGAEAVERSESDKGWFKGCVRWREREGGREREGERERERKRKKEEREREREKEREKEREREGEKGQGAEGDREK